MPRLPAICQNCEKLFPSGFYIGGKRNTFINCVSGPCPFCGHPEGLIPDGMYSALSDTVLEFISSRVKASHIRILIEILNQAKDEDVDAKTLSERIKNRVPELSTITKVLPKTRSELYQFIIALVIFLTFFINNFKKDNISHEDIENQVEVIVNNTIQNFYDSDKQGDLVKEKPKTIVAEPDKRKKKREQRKKKRRQAAKSRKRNK